MSNYIYKYELKKDETTWYTVSDGAVIESPVAVELKHSPNGWQDSTISYIRDLKYLGIFDETNVPFEFVEDGAKILRSIYYDIMQGSNGRCILVAKILLTESMTYETFLEGDIDFSQSSDEKNTFTVNIARRGLFEQLQKKESITYELDLNSPESANMVIDGVYFDCSGSWYPGNYSINVGSAPTSNTLVYAINDFAFAYSIPVYDGGNLNQPLPFIKPKTQVYIISEPDNFSSFIPYTFSGGSTDYAPNDSGVYIFKTNVALREINVEAYVEQIMDLPPDGFVTTMNVYLLVMSDTNPSTPIQSYLVSQYNNNGAGMTPFNSSFNLTIPTMPANSYLVLAEKAKRNGPGISADTFDVFFPSDNSFFNVKFQAKSASTPCKVLRTYDVVNKLVASISGGQGAVLSSLLQAPQTDSTSRFNNWDTSPYYHFMTSGSGLQQLTNPIMKLSFESISQHLFSVLGASFSIENNNLIIEKISEVFQDVLISKVGIATDIIVHDLKELMFNSIKVGYSYSDSDTTNGKQAINTTYEYAHTVDGRTKKELNAISEVVAEPTEIEQVRGQIFNTNNQASNRGDNDIYLIEADPILVSGSYVPYRPTVVNSGVIDPTGLYNVCIIPARNLLRLLPFINSLLTYGYLNYQTSDQNDELISTFVSGQIIAKENIPVGLTAYKGHNVKRLFLPYVFEYSCPSVFLYNQIKANPKGYIEFPFEDTFMKCFVMNVDLVPATGMCKVVGISHPDNDLTKLVR